MNTNDCWAALMPSSDPTRKGPRFFLAFVSTQHSCFDKTLFILFSPDSSLPVPWLLFHGFMNLACALGPYQSQPRFLHQSWFLVVECFVSFFFFLLSFCTVLLSCELYLVCSSCSVHLPVENHSKWTLSTKLCWNQGPTRSVEPSVVH